MQDGRSHRFIPTREVPGRWRPKTDSDRAICSRQLGDATSRAGIRSTPERRQRVPGTPELPAIEAATAATNGSGSNCGRSHRLCRHGLNALTLVRVPGRAELLTNTTDAPKPRRMAGLFPKEEWSLEEAAPDGYLPPGKKRRVLRRGSGVAVTPPQRSGVSYAALRICKESGILCRLGGLRHEGARAAIFGFSAVLRSGTVLVPQQIFPGESSQE